MSTCAGAPGDGTARDKSEKEVITHPGQRISGRDSGNSKTYSQDDRERGSTGRARDRRPSGMKRAAQIGIGAVGDCLTCFSDR